MDKVKALAKSILFGAIMLLFLILSAIIAKALKLSANRTYIFQGSCMLLSTAVPLFYIGIKNIKYRDVGWNKPTHDSLMHIFYYIPFVIALFFLLIDVKATSNYKGLIVMMYFYGCLAIAAEIYFRGLIQHFLRGKFNIVFLVIICGLLFAACNMHFFKRVTYTKHILVFVAGSGAFAGVATMVMENKGHIIGTIILNALYFFLSANYIPEGKRMLLAQGLCWGILLAYGLLMLIPYMKENKKAKKLEEQANEETIEASEEGFDEEGNMTIE